MECYVRQFEKYLKLSALVSLLTCWSALAQAAEKADLLQGIEKCKAYLTGIGAMVDPQKAYKCFEADGSPMSEGFMAYMHFNSKIMKNGLLDLDVADNEEASKAKAMAMILTLRTNLVAECNKEDGDACFILGASIYQGDPLDPYLPPNLGGSNTAAKDQAEAFALYWKSAKNDSVFGMLALSQSYEWGIGTREDIHKALEWALKAAQKGCVSAMKRTGALYAVGDGVHDAFGLLEAKVTGNTSQDYAKALEWYRNAADKGDTVAMRSIGDLYFNSTIGHDPFLAAAIATKKRGNDKGLKQSYKKAMKWYLRAADKGDSYAMECIGQMYKDGQGVEQSFTKALEWYLKAADNGNEDALSIGSIYIKGEGGVKQDFTKAMDWYRKAADKGNIEAMRFIGYMYANGVGVKLDYIKATHWYRQCADNGDAICMLELGNCYESGYGVKRDYKEAMEWYLKAAAKGSSSAMNSIGLLYEYDMEIKQDYQQAFKWFRKAADLGNLDAMSNMGKLYEEGKGVETSIANALKWYRKAVDKGNPSAMYHMGRLYFDGRGVTQNYENAMKWYQRAADKGVPLAMSMIADMYEEGLGVRASNSKAVEWRSKYDAAVADRENNVVADISTIELDQPKAPSYLVVKTIKFQNPLAITFLRLLKRVRYNSLPETTAKARL